MNKFSIIFCLGALVSVGLFAQPAKITIERVDRVEFGLNKSVPQISDRIFMKMTLELGGESFSNINPECLNRASINYSSDLPLPRAMGVTITSARTYFEGDGVEFADNPRIAYLVESASTSPELETELLQVYSCLRALKN